MEYYYQCELRARVNWGKCVCNPCPTSALDYHYLWIALICNIIEKLRGKAPNRNAMNFTNSNPKMPLQMILIEMHLSDHISEELSWVCNGSNLCNAWVYERANECPTAKWNFHSKLGIREPRRRNSTQSLNLKLCHAESKIFAATDPLSSSVCLWFVQNHVQSTMSIISQNYMQKKLPPEFAASHWK